MKVNMSITLVGGVRAQKRGRLTLIPGGAQVRDIRLKGHWSTTSRSGSGAMRGGHG